MKKKFIALIIFLVVVVPAIACKDEKRENYLIPIKRQESALEILAR